VGGVGGTGRRGLEIGSGWRETDSVRERRWRFASLRAADSPVRQWEWRIHRFAGRHRGGNRSTGGLWCRWLGAASGDPRMNVHRDTHIYTYIHIYIHTHHVTGWEMVRSPGHSIYISADTVGVTPRRPYLGGTVPGVRCRFGGMMPNARRRGGGYPGCPPKDHVTFVIFQTTKSTQILGFSPTGPLFTM
jgi:hypothetical protein